MPISIKQKENQKKYRDSPKGQRNTKKHHWLNQGMSFNDEDHFDEWYKRFKDSKCCEICFHDYSYWSKCLHHDHATAEVISVICNACNVKDREVLPSSGIVNIYYVKKTGGWEYRRIIKKVKHQRFFDTKLEALHYKIAHNLLIKTKN